MDAAGNLMLKHTVIYGYLNNRFFLQIISEFFRVAFHNLLKRATVEISTTSTFYGDGYA